MTGCHCCAVLKSLRILTRYSFLGHRLIRFNYTACNKFRHLAGIHNRRRRFFTRTEHLEGDFISQNPCSATHVEMSVVMNKTGQLLSCGIYQLWEKCFSIISNFHYRLCNKSNNLSKGNLNLAELLPNSILRRLSLASVTKSYEN